MSRLEGGVWEMSRWEGMGRLVSFLALLWLLRSLLGRHGRGMGWTKHDLGTDWFCSDAEARLMLVSLGLLALLLSLEV